MCVCVCVSVGIRVCVVLVWQDTFYRFGSGLTPHTNFKSGNICIFGTSSECETWPTCVWIALFLFPDKVFETRSPGQDLSADQLRDVAQTLGKRWEKAALHLGLKNEVLEDIKKEEMAEFKQRRKMLRVWKEQRSGKATAQDLLSGLEGLKVLPVNTRRLLEGNVFNPNPGSS